jgi:hypothetical protein
VVRCALEAERRDEDLVCPGERRGERLKVPADPGVDLAEGERAGHLGPIGEAGQLELDAGLGEMATLDRDEHRRRKGVLYVTEAQAHRRGVSGRSGRRRPGSLPR